MPRYEIVHPTTGKRLHVDGPSMPSAGAQRLLFARHHATALRAQSPTRDLYTRLVEEVLPEMNTPKSSREILALLKQSGSDIVADQTGFADWLRGQKGTITRGSILSRLMQEQEFRSLLGEHAGTQRADGRAAPMWQAVPGLVQGVATAQGRQSPDQKTDAQVTGVTALGPAEDEARKGDGT